MSTSTIKKRRRRIGYGHALDERMTPLQLIRFLNFVKLDAVQGCWLWTGHRDDKGYGQFKWGHRAHWAHRLAYVNFKAPIPDGMDVDHADPCHCPNCVNPDHLQLLERVENARDGSWRRWKKTLRVDEVPF